MASGQCSLCWSGARSRGEGERERRRAPVVEAEADDSADVVERDHCLALVGGQRARSLVGGDVAADAVHVKQRADLTDGDLERAVHLRVSRARRRRRQFLAQRRLLRLRGSAEGVRILRPPQDVFVSGHPR